MNLAAAVAWNTAIQVAGRALGLVISMAITALLTRYLGLGAYGQYVAASTYVALFVVLGDAGLFVATVRRVAREPNRRAAILGTAVSLRIATSAAALLLAFAAAWLIPSSRYPTYSHPVKLLTGLLAMQSFVALLSQFMTVPFRLHLRMDFAVWGEMLARAVNLLAVVAVVRMRGGLTAVGLAFLAGSIANLVYSWNAALRLEKFKMGWNRTLAGELLRESAILAVISFVGLIHFKVDTLILSFMRSPDEVGVYGVAYRVHEIFVLFPGFFVGLLFPVLSRLASESVDSLRYVFQRTCDTLLLAGTGGALLVFVGAPMFASLLGAPSAALPMQVLALALVPSYLSLGFSYALLAERKQHGILPLAACTTSINIVLSVICIQRWSYNGAAVVTFGTECLQVALLAWYWHRGRAWRLQTRALRVVTIAVILAIGMTATRSTWMPAEDASVAHRLLVLALWGCATSALYLGGILALKVVSFADVRRIVGAETSNEITAEAGDR